jgi:superfamily II RNA helicase
MNTIKTKYTLDEFQQEACEYIDQNINILVSAPTGSGKTAIAEYAIEKTKLTNNKYKIIYTCPIKSLCNEKYYDMNKNYANQYQIGLMTGDIIINPDADIIIMTTEVLYNLLIGGKKYKTNKLYEFNELNKIDDKKELEQTEIEQTEIEQTEKFDPKCVIFDEVHYINDDGRGHVWEKSIISCLVSYSCYLVLLSATIGNINALTDWLNTINLNKQFKSVVKLDRPVPLKEWVILDSDRIVNISGENYDKVLKHWAYLEKSGSSVSNELNKLCKKISITLDDDPELPIYLGMPAIFFVLSKNKCIELAEQVNSRYTTVKEELEILSFYDKNLSEYKSCSQYQNLRVIIGLGIAYHHSGLIPKIREVVEFLIKNKLIKIVFATETFAVGLNFPVKTVVMTSLTKPSESGMRELLVSEYKQMAGRAGRRFLDKVGNVIFWFYPSSIKSIRNAYPTWATVNSIINGPINSVESKYQIDPNYIIKTIESNSTRLLTDKSFKYYNSEKHRVRPEINIPDKYAKLYEIEQKIIEYSLMGMKYVDKSYTKLKHKLTSDEKEEFSNLLLTINKMAEKSHYENFIDYEKEIIYFLLEHEFIENNMESNIPNLLPKGQIAILFNEINPIIFTNEMDFILMNRENIIPILSMFIDDGNKQDTNSNSNIPDIIHMDKLVQTKYKDYINICSKWKYYPQNYELIKYWIDNPEITLDELSYEFGIDIGLIVKILIKMYQIVEELLGKLDSINKPELAEYINGVKQILIRHPLKIESLYTM